MMIIYADFYGGRWHYIWYSQDEGRNIEFRDLFHANSAIRANDGKGRIVYAEGK